MYYQRPLIYRILESFFRHRWLFFAALLSILVLLSLFVILRPRTWSAQYTVVLNDQSIRNPLATDQQAKNWQAVQQAVDHFQTLVSTKEFVGAALRNPDGTPVALNHPVDLKSDDDVLSLQKNVSVFANGADAFTVSLTYTDPQDCETVLKQLIQLFIERNAQEKSAYYTEEVTFVGQQVTKYKQALANAEAKLTAFKRQNVGNMPSMQEALQQQLTTLQTREQDLRIQVAENTDKASELQRQLGETPKTIVQSQTSGDSPLMIQLKALQTRLDIDLAVHQMKPNHPEVQALRAQITRLSRELHAKQRSGSSEASGLINQDVQPNPAYQQLRLQLSQIQADEKGLQTEAAQVSARIQDVQKGVARVPEAERTMSNLMRDYASDSDTYGNLTKHLQEAMVNEQIYLRQQRGMFELFETSPPQASTTRGKLTMLFLGGIFLAIVVAVGLVIASEALDRSIRDPYDAQRTLGVPVLAMLPDSPSLRSKDGKHNRPLLGGAERKTLGRMGHTKGLLPGAATLAAATSGGTTSAFSGGSFGPDHTAGNDGGTPTDGEQK